jgi:hypothetical protein
VLSEHQPSPGKDVEELLEADSWATRRAASIIEESV